MQILGGIIFFLIFLAIISALAQAQKKQNERLLEVGIPKAVEIASYQKWVSPYRLMNQAHFTKADAQFILQTACERGLLYQQVNGRYYLENPESYR